MGDFLLELYSEEIPAKMQITARDQLERLFKKKLDKSNLKASEIIGFVTPVRLGVIIKKLTFDKSGEKEEIRGPRVGAPDLAIQGFLKKNKILHNQLTLKKTEKGEFYVYERAIAKRSISEVLALISTEIISEFSWPKSMLWGSDYSLRWIRPLKNILALLFLEEEKVLIPIKVRGIASDIFTKGHSFMSPRPFQVESLAQYQTKLLEGKVILQPEDRLKRIIEMAQELCRKSGFKVVEDKSLVDEITGLSEFPTPVLGEIPKKYFELPQEVVVATMREHQKFISLIREKTSRVEGFLLVSNILTADNQMKVLEGNINVLNARLADALFFYQNDKNKIKNSGMNFFYEDLKKVSFHQKLGSQYDRVKRIEEIAVELAGSFNIDPKLIGKSAKLIKADLVSEMVIEFPSLQGVIGRHYALLDENSIEVANAVKEHYSPLGPNDNVPKGDISIILAISEKLEYLMAFWSIGIKPTGSKDPFALRRACLGIIRIIIENSLKLNLNELLDLSKLKIDKIDLLNFFKERIIHHLSDLGYDRAVILAVVNADNLQSLNYFPKLINNIEKYINSSEGKRVLAMNKRACNILNSFEEEISNIEKPLSEVGVREDFELRDTLMKAEREIENGLEQIDFDQIKNGISSLVKPLNKFFELVQINCQDQDLRLNSYKLLIDLQRVLKKIAAFSYIEVR